MLHYEDYYFCSYKVMFVFMIFVFIVRQDENNTMTRTVYPGERFRLTCDDDNRPYLLYQWFKNGYIIPGANYKDLEFNPFQHGDEGYYTCRMTGPDGDLLSRLTQLQLGK